MLCRVDLEWVLPQRKAVGESSLMCLGSLVSLTTVLSWWKHGQVIDATLEVLSQAQLSWHHVARQVVSWSASSWPTQNGSQGMILASFGVGWRAGGCHVAEMSVKVQSRAWRHPLIMVHLFGTRAEPNCVQSGKSHPGQWDSRASYPRSNASLSGPCFQDRWTKTKPSTPWLRTGMSDAQRTPVLN